MSDYAFTYRESICSNKKSPPGTKVFLWDHDIWTITILGRSAVYKAEQTKQRIRGKTYRLIKLDFCYSMMHTVIQCILVCIVNLKSDLRQDYGSAMVMDTEMITVPL